MRHAWKQSVKLLPEASQLKELTLVLQSTVQSEVVRSFFQCGMLAVWCFTANGEDTRALITPAGTF